MNAIGIDVSKGKSTVAVMRPFGEVVKAPFDVTHTAKDLSELANFILGLVGESRVVMEHTGKYAEPMIATLCKAGIFVCVVNAKLIHDYGGDTIRRVKTDKVDALNLTRTADRRYYSALKDYILDNHLRAFLHGKWENARTGNYFYYSYLEKRFECSFNLSSSGAYFYRYSASAKQQSNEIYISYKTADSITIYYRNRSFDMQRVY